MLELLVPTITSYEATSWLKVKQPNFTAALTRFALKNGIGLERKRKPYLGQYTGAGLCAIAVSIQEIALIRKYGKEIETRPLFLYASREDIETYQETDVETVMPHWILEYRARGEGNWLISDPTFRQFAIRTDPDQMLIGVPENRIGAIYNSWHIYVQKLIENPKGARNFFPQPETGEGKFYALHLEDIQAGRLEIGIRDYQKLLQAYR